MDREFRQMENLDRNKVKEKVRNFISTLDNARGISDTTKLIETGIIDSLNFIELILFIEKDFNIEIKLSDAQIEYFETINMLSEFIIGKRNQRR